MQHFFRRSTIGGRRYFIIRSPRPPPEFFSFLLAWEYVISCDYRETSSYFGNLLPWYEFELYRKNAVLGFMMI